MSVGEWFLLTLRVSHALAATVWLGGGVYYLIALRPAVSEGGADAGQVAGVAQRYFGEWAQIAALTMVVSGGVLIFDRLSAGNADLFYVSLMVVKILAALLAFAMTTVSPVRQRLAATGRLRPELIMMLGLIAFVIGLGFSSTFGLER